MKRGLKVWIRAVAMGLLVAMVLPATFELRLHTQDQGRGAIPHIEAIDFEHHADQCLGSAAVSHDATSQVPLPVVVVLGPDLVVVPNLEPRPCGAEPALRASSRAPPAPVAV